MGKADPRVRLRIFSYLRQGGIDLTTANRVASKVVGAMVGSGQLPNCAVQLAGAALTPDQKLESADPKAAGLLEPKAEPYEVGSSLGAKLGGPKATALGGRVGGAAKPGLSKPSFSGALPGARSSTNFAIIEPVLSRREVQAQMGTALSRGQIQTLVGEIQRTIR